MGLYFAGVPTTRVSTRSSYPDRGVELLTDGRSDFAARPVQRADAATTRRSAHLQNRSTAPIHRMPRDRTGHDHQPDVRPRTATRVDRPAAADSGHLAVEADYVWTGGATTRPAAELNMTYDPATGPTTVHRHHQPRYPNWGSVNMRFADGRSNYHALETALTKRFSNRWQGSATYTLSGLQGSEPAAVPGCGPMSAPACATFRSASSVPAASISLRRRRPASPRRVQRHLGVAEGLPVERAVFLRLRAAVLATSYGGDLRHPARTRSTRLRPDGTIVPRNNFVGKPLHRVDMRLQRRFPLGGRASIDGIRRGVQPVQSRELRLVCDRGDAARLWAAGAERRGRVPAADDAARFPGGVLGNLVVPAEHRAAVDAERGVGAELRARASRFRATR